MKPIDIKVILFSGWILAKKQSSLSSIIFRWLSLFSLKSGDWKINKKNFSTQMKILETLKLVMHFLNNEQDKQEKHTKQIG